MVSHATWQVGYFGQPGAWLLKNRDTWHEADERDEEEAERQRQVELAAELVERERAAELARAKTRMHERGGSNPLSLLSRTRASVISAAFRALASVLCPALAFHAVLPFS